MIKKLLALSVVFFAGCASLAPSVPEGYTGPLATLADTPRPETTSKGQIFALLEIDGAAVDNSFQASHRASANQGPTLRMVPFERKLPAHAMKVRIRGSHITGMPIHEIASRAVGKFYEVEGVVDFVPVADARYAVVGKLDKEGSSVWIEDAATHQPVTDKVVAK